MKGFREEPMVTFNKPDAEAKVPQQKGIS